MRRLPLLPNFPSSFCHIKYANIVDRRRYNISVAEERRLALERLRVICHSGLLSITDFRSNPLNIFAAHEIAAFADVSMATKMTVRLRLLFDWTCIT